MMKKVFMGLLAVAIACSLAHSGYTFGRYLAHHDKAQVNPEDVQDAAAG